MTKTAITIAAALSLAVAGAAEPNTLTPEEKAAGWQLLWDGKTLDGWVGEKGGCKAPPAKGWKIEDGILTVLPTSRITKGGKWEKLPREQAALGGGGDLVTKESFKDFELSVDFRLVLWYHTGNDTNARSKWQSRIISDTRSMPATLHIQLRRL